MLSKRRAMPQVRQSHNFTYQKLSLETKLSEKDKNNGKRMKYLHNIPIRRVIQSFPELLIDQIKSFKWKSTQGMQIKIKRILWSNIISNRPA